MHILDPLGVVSSVLMGQQVALVKANLGDDYNAGINVNIPLLGLPGVGSLNVNFKGSVSLDAGATFVLTDGFLVGGSLLNSLQVQNAHVDLGLNVGVGVSATLAGFGIALDGTIGLTFDVLPGESVTVTFRPEAGAAVTPERLRAALRAMTIADTY